MIERSDTLICSFGDIYHDRLEEEGWEVGEGKES